MINELNIELDRLRINGKLKAKNLESLFCFVIDHIQK